jgi:hypothetical protein
MEAHREYSRVQGQDHDACQPASGFAGTDRGLGIASLLEWRLYVSRLVDIVEVIEHISIETAGVTLDVFEADWRKRWLVERGLEIISEASRHLSDELKARHPEIPCSKVAGIGE